MDDAPATGHSAQSNRPERRQNHPALHVKLFQVTGGNQHARDNADRLLRVIRAMRKAEKRGGEQLQTPEPAIHLTGCGTPEHPIDDTHQQVAEHEPDDGGEHDELRRLDPTVDLDGP